MKTKGDLIASKTAHSAKNSSIDSFPSCFCATFRSYNKKSNLLNFYGYFFTSPIGIIFIKRISITRFLDTQHRTNLRLLEAFEAVK